MERKRVRTHYHFRLIVVSLIISIFSSLLTFSLKYITEHFEHKMFSNAGNINHYLFFILPTIGITAIYFLRKYLFEKRKNKGITEIYKTLDQRKDHLPFFKLPSHYLNGFLTVIFGGSTGIEVSTVVATATVGNVAYKREFSAKMYKRELICAGVVAGVAVLFGSPVAGWLFAIEVISRKLNKTIAISCTVSALAAYAFILLTHSEPLLPYSVDGWSWTAIPFFLLLSLLGGVLSAYFTWLVIHVKNFFGGISNNFLRVNLGALMVGASIVFLPFLYGDSYHGLIELVGKAVNHQAIPLGFLLLLVLIKPLVASLTLGAGGDGGVFAPSIVSGAVMGLLMATICNQYFGTHLVPINFALVGAAATLSSAIYAPFTAVILVCSLAPNGFVLFFPVLAANFIAKKCSQLILPYNVYTYKAETPVQELATQSLATPA